MDFIPPYDQVGLTPPGPWTNAAPQAGLKGSIVNADVFPAVQNEILAVIDAAGLTRNAANLAQLLAAIKILIPEYAPGAASKGGLAKDGSGNFLLALGNLNPDGAAIAGGDILALQRASDGALLSGTVAEIATFILAQQVSYGATVNGGLAKDGGNNFLLNLDNLPVETSFNANDKFAAFTEEAEDGLAGGVPFAGTLGNLAKFLASLGSPPPNGFVNYRDWATPGTYTFVPDPGCYAIEVIECHGSGGGGAYSGGAVAGGAGGDSVAGAYPVTPGVPITIVVPAGGLGGTPGSPNGSPGATASVGSLCSAVGGNGATGNTPGTPGTGSVGQDIFPGSPGGVGVSPGSGLYFPGFGGGSKGSGSNTTTGPVQNGTASGQGGTGGNNTGAAGSVGPNGGNGANGRVVIKQIIT